MQCLAIDNWDGSPEQVQTFQTQTGISFPILMMGFANGIRADYDATYNWWFVIGGDGVIAYRGQYDDAAIRAAIDDGIANLSLSAAGDAPEAGHTLGAAFPNPFNPRTSIPFELAADGGEVSVRLEILDLRGRVVRTVLNGTRPGGQSYMADWDGSDDAGRNLPSGVYLTRLVVDGVSTSRLITLMK